MKWYCEEISKCKHEITIKWKVRDVDLIKARKKKKKTLSPCTCEHCKCSSPTNPPKFTQPYLLRAELNHLHQLPLAAAEPRPQHVAQAPPIGRHHIDPSRARAAA